MKRNRLNKKMSPIQPGSAPGIIIPPCWEVDENSVTPEDIYLNRRKFLVGLGQVGLAAFVGYTLPGWMAPTPARAASRTALAATPESLTSRYNNFYEFTMDKSRVHELARVLQPEDWTIRVEGLV